MNRRLANLELGLQALVEGFSSELQANTQRYEGRIASLEKQTASYTKLASAKHSFQSSKGVQELAMAVAQCDGMHVGGKQD